MDELDQIVNHLLTCPDCIYDPQPWFTHIKKEKNNMSAFDRQVSAQRKQDKPVTKCTCNPSRFRDVTHHEYNCKSLKKTTLPKQTQRGSQQARHTPGPWKVGTTFHHHCIYGTKGSGEKQGYLLAKAATNGSFSDALNENDPETLANARLIASAPELLNLVRGYLNTYPLDEYSVKAAEAIARAEGKGA